MYPASGAYERMRWKPATRMWICCIRKECKRFSPRRRLWRLRSASIACAKTRGELTLVQRAALQCKNALKISHSQWLHATHHY